MTLSGCHTCQSEKAWSCENMVTLSFLRLSPTARDKALTGICHLQPPFQKPSVLFCFGCLVNRFGVRIRVILGLDKDQRPDKARLGSGYYILSPLHTVLSQKKKKTIAAEACQYLFSRLQKASRLTSEGSQINRCNNRHRLLMLQSCNQRWTTMTIW